MSLRPCSVCNERVPGKLATAYCAWFLTDGERTAWKQKLCSGCLVEQYKPLLQNGSSTSPGSLTCPGCGGSSETDLDPVYLTLYLPKSEPKEFELSMCAACAAKIRVVMQLGAVKLENREAGLRGPSTSSPDPWSTLEL